MMPYTIGSLLARRSSSDATLSSSSPDSVTTPLETSGAHAHVWHARAVAPRAGTRAAAARQLAGIVYDDDAWYVGQVNRDHVAHGAGEMRFPDGTIYRGDFGAGRAHGAGRVRYDGGAYEGHFVRGLYHNHGMLVTHAYEYKGEWLEGREHGRGEAVVRTAPGARTRINGVFADGVPHGPCVETHMRSMQAHRVAETTAPTTTTTTTTTPPSTMTTTTTYSGPFVHGRRTGRASLHCVVESVPSGDASAPIEQLATLEYDGNFVDGHYDGEGRSRVTRRGEPTQQYKGAFLRSVPDGEGAWHVDERLIYRGAWRAGAPHGRGTRWLADGTRIEAAKWQRDVAHGDILVVTAPPACTRYAFTAPHDTGVNVVDVARHAAHAALYGGVLGALAAPFAMLGAPFAMLNPALCMPTARTIDDDDGVAVDDGATMRRAPARDDSTNNNNSSNSSSSSGSKDGAKAAGPTPLDDEG